MYVYIYIYIYYDKMYTYMLYIHVYIYIYIHYRALRRSETSKGAAPLPTPEVHGNWLVAIGRSPLLYHSDIKHSTGT